MPRSADGAIRLLLTLLDEAFDRRSWHGANLRGSLRGVSARGAAWRPAPGRHNVWELAVHAAYWKYAVRNRLQGGKRGAFALAGSNWFVRDGGGEAAWRKDLVLLVAEHRRLRETVAGLSPRALSRPVGGGFDVGGLVRGAAAHDLYHTGQIQVLKRLRRG
jgi:hypothetical protein